MQDTTEQRNNHGSNEFYEGNKIGGLTNVIAVPADYSTFDSVDDILRDATRWGLVDELRVRLLGERPDSGLAADVIAQVFSWVADGRTLDERGFRATVAITSIRPDLFSGASLEKLGEASGRSKQAVWRMQSEFKRLVGLSAY